MLLLSYITPEQWQNNQPLGRKDPPGHFGCTSKCRLSSLLKNFTTESSAKGQSGVCTELPQEQPSSGKDLLYLVETNIEVPDREKPA